MESAPTPTSPRKKLKSPFQEAVNPKTCITCSNVPDGLFDPSAAKKHFSKFGRVQKIRLFAKRHMCIIEYDQPSSAERALLNAGAFDGFMFDVTRYKARVRRRSTRKEDDPDWVPDSDVEEELSAMGGAPTYRVTRQNMDKTPPTKPAAPTPRMKALQRTVRQPLKKKITPVREKPVAMQSIGCTIEPPVAVSSTQASYSTTEAASELCQLRSKISITPDEQWRILDARDRILRAWGGAGSRIKVGGATIGTCQDMCPEKELLQRQSEHQVMTLETVLDSDGELEPWRAVKQYSRSSADQEIPMCYELRPPKVLLRTCEYLLHEIADTKRQVSLADWFHFMWDRLRSIRKDITQQALCCADSIYLVEMCARFHAHCAARLADLEHTQFDQKLNTDNLTKCLQTLKHMYADVSAEDKPREAEFRGYVALLNLGDANFWWEIKQLPDSIQKSAPILFAIKVFNAIDNNNYVRFFRLVKHEATYLQACILLRYFNDVRARALARIVKAYAPRGGSRYPAEDMMRTLAFESIENLKSFISHYGLRFSRTDDSELSVILDRNQFIEDSDPYPIARAINLIEVKRNCSVGEIIAGGKLPDTGYSRHVLYTSFTPDGRLKESALTAEDQGYNTINDSNQEIQALKAEIQRLTQGGRAAINERLSETRSNTFTKPELKSTSPKTAHKFATPIHLPSENKLFSFTPAIPVASTEIIKNSPEKIFNSDKNIFSFSKPQDTAMTNNIFVGKETVKSLFDSKPSATSNIFSKPNVDNGPNSQSLFGTIKSDVVLSQTFENKSNLFGSANKNLFSAKEDTVTDRQTPFGGGNIFSAKTGKSDDPPFENKNIFATKTENSSPFETKNIFARKTERFDNQPSFESKNIFSSKTDKSDNPPAFESKNIFAAKDEKSAGNTVFGKNIFAAKEVKTSENPTVFGSKSIFATKDEKSADHPVFGTKNIFAPKETNNPENATVFGGKNIFTVKEDKVAENQNPFGNKNIFTSTNNDLFAKSDSTLKLGKGEPIFGKPTDTGSDETKPPSTIFGGFGKATETANIFGKPESSSLFAKSEADKPPTIFANGETSTKVSPGSLFKSVLTAPNGPDSKSYSIFQSKNKAQTVADNILNSVSAINAPSVYEFDENENEERKQLEMQRQHEERVKEEERKLQEKIKKEEEMRRQELRRQEEERRKEEARRKQEELKLLEEKRRKEEERKQEELRKKLEEERKAELKRKAEEERKFKERVDRESTDLVEELIDEIQNETVNTAMKEELDEFNNLVQFASSITDEIISNLCFEICQSEMKAEEFLTHKLMRKWFYVWRSQHRRNVERRNLLDDTPVWIPHNTPEQEAILLRRMVENAALKNMNAIHRGYKFTGELKQMPTPEPYNIMEIIRSPLLKRMKQISYPYDKCFFWKIALISPGLTKWICRKTHLQTWLMDVFSDGRRHDVSDTLIHVGKQSWNHLMDFAISVSLTEKDQGSSQNEAVDGANALLFYGTEYDDDLMVGIEETLKYKYPYQKVPVAVIIPVMKNDSLCIRLENRLSEFVMRNMISAYRVFVIDLENVSESLNVTTKTAMRWLAKNYPLIPPLEIDYLKSICQRYLGNEIWYKLKSEVDGRMNLVIKDLHRLVKCYNTAVDKLTDVITDEDLFNYATFPLEFQPYLDGMSPYPKPYEFIPSSVRTSENVSAIKRIMSQLKLPDPSTEFKPVNAITMQQQITNYCYQIGWFENPEEVICKVVAVLPNELSNMSMPCNDFRQFYAHYNLLDFMTIIVYEKINRLKNFENRFAIYNKSVLDEYRSALWLHELNIVNELKHKALEYEDEIDFFIDAKRRKIEMDSMECLMLEDKDKTLVEKQIKEKDVNISNYNNCTEAVKQLEQLLEKEKIKSLQFENLLKAALSDL